MHSARKCYLLAFFIAASDHLIDFAGNEKKLSIDEKKK